jgi:NADH:ubiquinone oxidoreductase subunit C
MNSENEKDEQSSETAATSEDVVSLSKDEAKNFYEEKGIDFSPDSPVSPRPIPQFEKSISDKIASKFGSKVTVDYVRSNRFRVSTKKEDILDVAFFIRDELGYDHAESVAGVDYPDSKEIEVVYHLGSYTDDKLAAQVLTLATRVPREEIPNPGKDSTRMTSLREVFYSVEFHERECFEMFGVYFEGHPDNRRLLLPEDWADIPPFRKDFKIKGR